MYRYFFAILVMATLGAPAGAQVKESDVSFRVTVGGVRVSKNGQEVYGRDSTEVEITGPGSKTEKILDTGSKTVHKLRTEENKEVMKALGTIVPPPPIVQQKIVQQHHHHTHNHNTYVTPAPTFVTPTPAVVVPLGCPPIPVTISYSEARNFGGTWWLWTGYRYSHYYSGGYWVPYP